MHKRKRFGTLSLTTVLCVALAGCTENSPEPEATPTPIPVQETQCATATPAPPTPTEVAYRELGGMEILIGDHWSPDDPPTYGFPTLETTVSLELEKKYKFRVLEKSVASWGEMVEEYVSSVETRTPKAHIFKLDCRFVAEPMAKGLFYDLATLDEFDFSEDKWNDSVRELMTVGDSIFGMKVGASEPRGGVIFNKRLFEEAGLDPNLPYDLQASGEWTWSKFEELCEILTRDTDGDGQTDVYATVSQGAATIQCLVASTGSGFVEMDENGVLHNNLESEEVTEALNFAVDLYQKGYEMPQPKDSQWDYFVPAFQEGKAAMQFNEIGYCETFGYYGDGMEDKVGYVMPPKPDGTEQYHSYLCDEIFVIPSCYDAETAGNIAYAYNLYMDRLVAEEYWGEDYSCYFWNKEVVDGKEEDFPDERVDETLQYFADAVNTKQLRESLVYGLGDEIGPDLLWMYPFEIVPPEEQVKLIAEKWDALIEETNRGRRNTDEE